MINSSFVTLILKNSSLNPTFRIPNEDFDSIDFAMYRDLDRQPYCSFLTINTMDGICVMANTSHIQAAILQVKPGIGELIASPGLSLVQIYLAGHDTAQTEKRVPADQIAELFNGLGSKDEILPFPCLTSATGRVVMVNPNEITLISAHSILLAQGQKIINARDAGRP